MDAYGRIDGVPATAVTGIGTLDAPVGFLVVGGDGDGHHFVLLPGGDVETTAHGERGVDAHHLLPHFQQVRVLPGMYLGGGFALAAAEVGAQLQYQFAFFLPQGEPVVRFAFCVAHAAGAPRFVAMLQVYGVFFRHGVGGEHWGQQHGEGCGGGFGFFTSGSGIFRGRHQFERDAAADFLQTCFGNEHLMRMSTDKQAVDVFATVNAAQAEDVRGEQHTETHHSFRRGTCYLYFILPAHQFLFREFAYQTAAAVEHDHYGMRAAFGEHHPAQHEVYRHFPFQADAFVTAPILYALVGDPRYDKCHCGYVC
nr:DUF2867 domain-containing protein [uncultured Bacteroides sp.]